MENRITKTPFQSPSGSNHPRSSADTSVDPAKHPVLSRLIEEVRNEGRVEAVYDRVHNRHNRGR